MRPTQRLCLLALLTPAFAPAATAGGAKPGPVPPETLRVSDPAEFSRQPANWTAAGMVLSNHPTPSDHGELVTAWTHGDLDLEFDYLLAGGSASLVYLQGRYPVPLPTYEQHTDVPALTALGLAAKAPGLWQHLHAIFRAPRFDPHGHKLSAARLMRVELNDCLVLEDYEFPGPTPGAAYADEQPAGPLLWSGDAVVSLRHIRYRRIKLGAALDTARFSYEDLPGVAGGVRMTGPLAIPRAGEYVLSAKTKGVAQISVDGTRCLGPVALSEGEHVLRVEYRPDPLNEERLQLELSGVGIPRQAYALVSGALEPADRKPPTPMPIAPTDRVRVQRGFVPFADGERFHVLSVGTPQGLNYSYDLERDTVLQVWRGGFLDMSEMWHERGEPQIVQPLGGRVALDGHAPFAEPIRERGYDLESNGQPVFQSTVAGRGVSDRIAPTDDGRGLRRELTIAAGSAPVTVTLARGGPMEALGKGRFAVNDRAYFIQWERGETEQGPVVAAGAGQERVLQVTVPPSTRPQTISYEMAW